MINTILRKIKTSDRLPDKDKWYFVNHATNAPIDGIGDNLRWISETQKWYGLKFSDVFEAHDVEFWYEEVKESTLLKDLGTKIYSKQEVEDFLQKQRELSSKKAKLILFTPFSQETDGDSVRSFRVHDNLTIDIDEYSILNARYKIN